MSIRPLLLSAIAVAGLVCFYGATSAQTPNAGAPAASERAQVLAAAMQTAGIVRHADIRYARTSGVDAERQSLDVYTTPALKNAPVVVFVHGGSWQRGSKLAVLSKPLAFAPAGFVTVSMNYRFRPSAELTDMAADVASATAWVRANIATYGGDPDRIILMGHSAGAHLVAVVGADTPFLKSAGVPRSAIRGVVPLDTGPYDVALQMDGRNATSPYGKMLELVFGLDRAKWAAVSPMSHVAAGLPPFLVVSSDNRPDVKTQAIPFTEKLTGAGVDAEWFLGKDLDHEGVNAEIGAGDNPLTAKVVAFLKRTTATR